MLLHAAFVGLNTSPQPISRSRGMQCKQGPRSRVNCCVLGPHAGGGVTQGGMIMTRASGWVATLFMPRAASADP